MNYHRYIDLDVVNGVGNRCTLYVSGCEHRCPGCYNASTWSPSSGHAFTDELKDQIINDLQDRRVKRHGLTLTGGDPLHPLNCEGVLDLAQSVKLSCPDKTIWLWTGYIYEQLTSAQLAVLEYVDVLIDGPFIQSLADPSLRFRGSSNQRLIGRSERGTREIDG